VLKKRQWSGIAGGPIEILVPPTLDLGFDNVTEGFLIFEGVLVRVVEALEFAPESCFVVDFVGD
jgi:hypothetical protein